jgi:ABC-type transporter lipoprotein component MlaA
VTGQRHSAIFVLALVLLGVSVQSRADMLPPDALVPEPELTRLDRVNSTQMRLNDWLLTHVFDGAARGYNWVMPKWGQRRLASMLRNLRGPRDAVNSLLQGKPVRSGRHLARFVVDSTLGVAGAFEVGDAWLGLRASPETFNETLGVYRVGSGPFLVLPVIGETSPRRLVGGLVDTFLYPLGWVPPPGVATAASVGARMLEEVGAMSRRMPETGATKRGWRTYENILAAATAAPYLERKVLFYENAALDVAE